MVKFSFLHASVRTIGCLRTDFHPPYALYCELCVLASARVGGVLPLGGDV